MSALGVWNAEYPAVNMQRRYPFTPGATLTSGPMTIPNDFIVDMQISVPYGDQFSDPTAFYVSTIAVFGNGATVTIGYNGVDVGHAVVSKSALQPLTTIVAITGLSGYSVLHGTLEVGRMDNLAAYPGVWTFTLASAQLEPTVVRLAPHSVSSITLSSGARLTGDVVISAGSNIRIRDIGNTIYLDALGTISMGYAEDCQCETVQLGTPIYRINGLGPDTNGDFTIIGFNCTSINSAENGIAIDDTCAKPCCGCPELEVITDQLESITGDMSTMWTMVNQMSSGLSGAGY